MIPEQRLSTELVFRPYLSPDGLEPQPLVDYEMGGIGLNDPSAGLQFQVWTARARVGINNIGTVSVSAPNSPEITLFSLPGITEISLAFDQNMNPFIGFMQNGMARFWWFDTTVGMQIFTDLPSGSRGAKCCLDDKRSGQFAASDIILTYIRNDNLYFRAQRDRYLIEYLLKTGETQDVLRVGMHDRLRLQFAIGQMEFPVGTLIHRGTTQLNRRVTTQGANRKLVGVAHG